MLRSAKLLILAFLVGAAVMATDAPAQTTIAPGNGELSAALPTITLKVFT